MEAKPKRSRKYTFIFLFLGFLIWLAVIGIISAVGLFSINQIFTFDNLVSLHTTYPVFLLIDALALACFLLFVWVGLEKDRFHNTRRQSEWLAQNHQVEVQQLQSEQDTERQAEILRLNQLQAEQDQKHQEEILLLNQLQVEQDTKHQEEILQLNNQIDEQGKKFQDLEAIIRRGKQQWEATFDAVDDPILLADEAGVILRCNRATGEVFQAGFSEIIGRGIDDLFASESDSLQGMTPGERKQIKAPQVEVSYEVSKNHLLVDGRQEGWVYIFRNISAQKQALQEQQRLTHYYELLVNNNPVAIATLNLEDRIIDCNPAFEKLFYYNKRESLGWKADLLISPSDRVEENQRMAEAVHKGETVHKVTQRRRKDGSVLDVEMFWIPVIMAGKQAGSLGLYHDVSDLVRSQRGPLADVEQAPGEAAPVLMAKVVEDAFLSRPAPIETTAEPAEAVEAVPFLSPELEEAEAEQVETLQPAEPAEELEAVPFPSTELEEEPEEQAATLEPDGEIAGVSPVAQPRRRVIPVEKIEGIGPVYAQKLLEIGVKTTGDLLDRGKDRKGREALIEETGISAALVLKWVNMADLMRVPGIGEEYSELLEKAGVDTVKELRNRIPKNLFEAMIRVNEAHQLVRRTPHLSEVEGWVKEAKGLETVLTY